MNLIVNIDTATELAHVSIARNGQIIGVLHNENQQDHAAFLQVAIKKLAAENGISLSDFDAIAVTGGPGSYTGLRVGLSSAKGLCFALGKPLIMIPTLELMAVSAASPADELICPMIDARRMEVFYALYSRNNELISSPSTIVLEADSFGEELAQKRINFCGSGAEKWKKICDHPNASFTTLSETDSSMARLSLQYLQNKGFADLAYSEPFYLKEFHDSSKK